MLVTLKRLRPEMDAAQLTHGMKQCQVLLKHLMRHRLAWPFNNPIDPIGLNIPDYFCIIKYPMDLGTIKQKLASGLYNNENEFAKDVRLVWQNTFVYNLSLIHISEPTRPY